MEQNRLQDWRRDIAEPALEKIKAIGVSVKQQVQKKTMGQLVKNEKAIIKEIDHVSDEVKRA